MWVLKPNWITHGHSRNLELGILSIDIDSLSYRFLTSCFDGSICVWNLAYVLTGEDIDVQLAKVCQHEGPVNCVRWSPNAQYFASGSDDTFVLVWEQSEVNTSDSKEQWRAVLSLRAHTSDVKEVAWSPDGKVLVSGGVDNLIYVWDVVRKVSAPIAVLKEHIGFINGLTFDPLNQYLASLADDNQLIIWDTLSWSVVSRTAKVFHPNRYQQTRRISFTPDGKTLIHPGQRKSTYKFTASVVEREKWTPLRYLAGHVKAVSVVKACPVMFKGKDGPAWVVAVGGYDCALSIWKDGEEPMAIRDLFDSAIADISWVADGSAVLACSSDGTVAVLCFDGAELGQSLSPLEHSQLMTGLYGAEPPKPLAVVKKEEKPVKSEVKPVSNCQTETRTSTGRRRIQPILLSSPVSTSHLFHEPPEAPQSIAPCPVDLPAVNIFRYNLSIDPPLQGVPSVTEDNQGVLVVEVSQPNGSQWQISLTLNGTSLWTRLSATAVRQVKGNQYYVVVLLADHTAVVYSALGFLTIPPASLGTSLHFQVTGYFLFAISAEKELGIFNLAASQCEFRGVVACLHDEVDSVFYENGVPLIKFKTGGYLHYDKALQMWVRPIYHDLARASVEEGFLSLESNLFIARSRQDWPVYLELLSNYTNQLLSNPQPLRKRAFLAELQKISAEGGNDLVQTLIHRLSL